MYNNVIKYHSISVWVFFVLPFRLVHFLWHHKRKIPKSIGHNSNQWHHANVLAVWRRRPLCQPRRHDLKKIMIEHFMLFPVVQFIREGAVPVYQATILKTKGILDNQKLWGCRCTVLWHFSAQVELLVRLFPDEEFVLTKVYQDFKKLFKSTIKQ